MALNSKQALNWAQLTWGEKCYTLKSDGATGEKACDSIFIDDANNLHLVLAADDERIIGNGHWYQVSVMIKGKNLAEVRTP